MKQRPYRPGMLVYTVLDATPEVIRFLGFGIYEGNHTPPRACGNPLEEFLFGGNPRIRLADKRVVWGYQCYWAGIERWAPWVGQRLVIPSQLDGTPDFAKLCEEYGVSIADLTSIAGEGLKYGCITLAEKLDEGGIPEALLDAVIPAIPAWLEAHTHRCACGEKFWDDDQEAITNHEYDCAAYHDELNEGDEDSPRGYRPRPRSPWRSSASSEQMVRY